MRIHLIFALLTAVAASQQDDPTVAGRNAETASLPLRDAAGKVMRDASLMAERNLLEKRDATGRCPEGQTPVSKGVTSSPNGCGPEKFEGLVPELWFHACCNSHDSCYDDCSKSKDQCDNDFHTCMRAACDVEFSGFWKTIARYGCRGKAGVYFGAVKLGGQSSFEGSTATHCTCA